MRGLRWAYGNTRRRVIHASARHASVSAVTLKRRYSPCTIKNPNVQQEKERN